MTLYCTTCKTKREAKDVKEITLENGMPAREGVCPVCNAKLLEVVHRNACQ